MTAPPLDVFAAILVGGEGRRLGGVTKATLTIGEQSLLTRLRTRLGPQAGGTVLSVAPDQAGADWVRATGLPAVADAQPGAGPLAGIAAVLAWVRREAPAVRCVITVPVDVPFVPRDLVARLSAAGGLAVAESAGRRHHAIACWPVSLGDAAAEAVAAGEGALHRFCAGRDAVALAWPAEPFDPFFNINTPDDLRAAGRIAVLADAQAPRSFA